MTQRRVTVMAHFDPGVQLAPHVRRFLREVTLMSDETTLVTTSGVGAEGLAWAESHGVRVLERENVGHDFMSYQMGLAQSTIDDDTEVLVCNDSFVGTTIPLPEIWRRMAGSPANLWGMTSSLEQLRYPDGTTREGPVTEHVQSYFLVFRPGVGTSAAFRTFWGDVAPLPDKLAVIDRYEIGLTETLVAAGYRFDAFYKPTVAESWRALRRSVWWYHAYAFVAHQRWTGARWVATQIPRRGRRLNYNPTILSADAVFSGRLPLVKTQVLRDDPARLGADRLLDGCEAAFPEVFEGVRAYIERTEVAYRAMRPEPEVDPEGVWLLSQPGVVAGFEMMKYRTPLDA